MAVLDLFPSTGLTCQCLSPTPTGGSRSIVLHILEVLWQRRSPSKTSLDGGKYVRLKKVSEVLISVNPMTDTMTHEFQFIMDIENLNTLFILREALFRLADVLREVVFMMR